MFKSVSLHGRYTQNSITNDWRKVWPGGIIFFTFDPTLSKFLIICLSCSKLMHSTKHYKDSTCHTSKQAHIQGQKQTNPHTSKHKMHKFEHTSLKGTLQCLFADDGTMSLINQSMEIIQRHTCILFQKTLFVPPAMKLTRELVVVFSSVDGNRYVT